MQPVPIDDSRVWEGATRKVIAPPDGDLTNDKIRPVEALIDFEDNSPRFNMLIQLEEGDLEKLKENPRIWLSIYTNRLPPFGITLEHDAFG